MPWGDASLSRVGVQGQKARLAQLHISRALGGGQEERGGTLQRVPPSRLRRPGEHLRSLCMKSFPSRLGALAHF